MSDVARRSALVRTDVTYDVARRSELTRTEGRKPTPCDPHGGCITCSDAAPPMVVARVDAERGIALCEDDRGVRSSVEIALVEPVAPGDVLLVHAGTALAHADEAAPFPAPPDAAGTRA